MYMYMYIYIYTYYVHMYVYIKPYIDPMCGYMYLPAQSAVKALNLSMKELINERPKGAKEGWLMPPRICTIPENGLNQVYYTGDAAGERETTYTAGKQSHGTFDPGGMPDGYRLGSCVETPLL